MSSRVILDVLVKENNLLPLPGIETPDSRLHKLVLIPTPELPVPSE
jgi:hypothetical protein